jgi:hypothetical protein
MTVTAICGATSAYGSHFDWKTTRFSMMAGRALNGSVRSNARG